MIVVDVDRWRWPTLLEIALFRRNNVMNVFLVAPERASVAIGFITALNVAIVWLPIAMRLHVSS